MGVLADRASHEHAGQGGKERSVLIGHEVTDDLTPNPLGELTGAGPLLNGLLARVIG
jgi:hypothetical protein